MFNVYLFVCVCVHAYMCVCVCVCMDIMYHFVYMCNDCEGMGRHVCMFFFCDSFGLTRVHVFFCVTLLICLSVCIILCTLYRSTAFCPDSDSLQ